MAEITDMQRGGQIYTTLCQIYSAQMCIFGHIFGNVFHMCLHFEYIDISRQGLRICRGNRDAKSGRSGRYICAIFF